MIYGMRLVKDGFGGQKRCWSKCKRRRKCWDLFIEEGTRWKTLKKLRKWQFKREINDICVLESFSIGDLKKIYFIKKMKLF